MAEFIKIPPLEIGDKGEWILAGELVYKSDLLDEPVIIHTGFETDLSSIPRILTPVFPINGRHRAAAIVHDYLCLEGEVGRKLADRVFLEAMRVSEVSSWRRYLMYAGLRIANWWRK